MNLAKTLKSAFLLTLSILLFTSISQAKKAPGPESIVNRPFIKPNYSPPLPLTDAFNKDGYATRIYSPHFQSGYKDHSRIVDDYLRQNQRLLGIKEDGTDLDLFSVRHSLVGYHFRYQQKWQGVPVFASWVEVNIRYDGKISSVISDYHQGIDISTVPAISAKEAEYLAIANVEVKSTCVVDGNVIARLREGKLLQVGISQLLDAAVGRGTANVGQQLSDYRVDSRSLPL